MGISIDEVRRVADLAMLKFDHSELEQLTAELSTILDYFERLQAVDTSEVEPDLGPPIKEATLRPDQRTPCLPPEQALANAPDRSGGHFRVPRVIG